MDAAKAQIVVSSLISSGLMVQAQINGNDWTVIVTSNSPLTSQVVEAFRAQQGINATVQQVVLT